MACFLCCFIFSFCPRIFSGSYRQAVSRTESSADIVLGRIGQLSLAASPESLVGRPLFLALAGVGWQVRSIGVGCGLNP